MPEAVIADLFAGEKVLMHGSYRHIRWSLSVCGSWGGRQRQTCDNSDAFMMDMSLGAPHNELSRRARVLDTDMKDAPSYVTDTGLEGREAKDQYVFSSNVL